MRGALGISGGRHVVPTIRAAGRTLGEGEIAGLEVFQAADRPDRLEAWIARRSGGRLPLDGVLGPGVGLRALLGDEVLFEGEVARASSSLDPRRGAALTIVGYAEYHRLRDLSPGARYWQAADSEIAERIASSLDLASTVEPGPRIHASITREGDPLRFLRGLARESGFQLAVTRRRLYFVRELPETGEAIRIDASSGLASWEETDGRTGRVGRALLAGDPRLRPIAAIVAAPAGAPPRRWRIARAIHRIGRGGYTTEVEILERGMDMEDL